MTFKWGCHSGRVSVSLLAKPVCKNRCMYSLWPPSLCDLPILVAHSADFLSFKALDFGCGFLANAFEYTIDIQAAISYVMLFSFPITQSTTCEGSLCPILRHWTLLIFQNPFWYCSSSSPSKVFFFCMTKNLLQLHVLPYTEARTSQVFKDQCCSSRAHGLYLFSIMHQPSLILSA